MTGMEAWYFLIGIQYVANSFKLNLIYNGTNYIQQNIPKMLSY